MILEIYPSKLYSNASSTSISLVPSSSRISSCSSGFHTAYRSPSASAAFSERISLIRFVASSRFSHRIRSTISFLMLLFTL